MPQAGDHVDQVLMDFVVTLVVSDTFRAAFQNPMHRERMMDEAGLSPDAKNAVRDGNAGAVERLLNTQIIVPRKPRKPTPRKPSKPKKSRPAKKSSRKKR
jgi:hypothetical protein